MQTRIGRERPVKAASAAIAIGASVVLLWLIEAVDQVARGALDQYGIQSWNPASLPSVFVAPLLHAGWGHLISNTLPFAVLGFLVLVGGLAKAVWATLSSVLASGAFAWLLSPPNTVTVGASGLIFGWLTYLLTRGVLSRDGKQIVIAVAVLLLYGGVLWGVLPSQPGVSWQAHLGGAIGGMLAAWLINRRAVARRRRSPLAA